MMVALAAATYQLSTHAAIMITKSLRFAGSCADRLATSNNQYTYLSRRTLVRYAQHQEIRPQLASRTSPQDLSLAYADEATADRKLAKR